MEQSRGYSIGGGSNGSGAYAAKSASVEGPQVQDQMRGIQTLLEELVKAREALRSRLGPVSRGTGEQKEPNNVPESALVPLANDLRSVAKNLRASVDDLHRICDAVEL